MKPIIRRLALLVILAALPLCAQDKLNAVRVGPNASTMVTEDHSSFVVEKPFEYKLTFGSPSDDKLWFEPNNKLKIMVFWLRIENVSDRPRQLNIARFTATDDEGKSYPILSSDEAVHRFIEVVGTTQGLLGKTMHGASLGRAANKRTEAQVRDDATRYSLQSGQIPPHTVQDGLIYFEGPQRKKYTMTVELGDLWAKPFTFKPK
jgi:hypothetical protein